MGTISEEKILEATGKEWKEWTSLLDGAGARDLPHKEIAAWLHDVHNVDGWWAQGLTVRYEHEIGRRQPGQESDGTFTVSASRVLAGTPKETLEWWQQKIVETPELNGQTLVKSDTSKTDKRRYFKARLSDNTRIIVGIEEKAPNKSLLALAHEKLQTKESADEWKEFWKAFLAGEE